MLYTLSQAAEILGVSRRAVAKRMSGCQNYQVNGRGGLKFYPLEAFPESIQAQLRPSQSNNETPIESQSVESSTNLDSFSATTVVVEPITAPPTKPLPIGNQKKMDLLDAWREIMAIQATWCQGKEFTQQRDKDEQFSIAVAAGEVPEVAQYLPAIKWGNKTGISRGSLQRYRERFKSHGLSGYLRNTAKVKNSPIELNPQLKEMIINHLISFPAAQLTRIWKDVKKLHPECPRLTAFRRWTKDWIAENHSFYLHETDIDKWRNTYKVAFGTHNSTFAPNQIWELDSTPADLALPDGRHCALGLIDVHTRRAMVLANKSSTAAAVLSILRQAIISWGLPEAIRTDNGSDYISHAVKRFCAQMHIEHLICTPGTPQAKPYIERFFGTMSHDVMPMLPGYLGHNVATVTKLRGGQKGEAIKAAMDAGMFQNWLDHWLATEYHPRIHSSLKRSPNEAWASALAQGWRPVMVEDIRRLDLLLAMVGKRKVKKTGIDLTPGVYIAPDLRIGEWVWVSTDAAEMGRIYWFHEDGTYGGVAEDAALMGIDRREVTLAAMQAQKADLKNAKAKFKKIKTDIKPYVAQELAQIINAANPPPDNVIPFKPKAETQTAETKSSDQPVPEELFKALATGYVAGDLHSAVWALHPDRLGRISARAKTQIDQIRWHLREQGITEQNYQEFFDDCARLADERIATLTPQTATL